MALFNFGKKKKEKWPAPKESAVKEEQKAPVKAPALPKADTTKGGAVAAILEKDIIIGPRITEKGAYVAEDGIYVFNVRKGATKPEVSAAIRALYNVHPRKVRLVEVKTKKVSPRGRSAYGVTGGGRKAYVYLKKGEKIEII